METGIELKEGDQMQPFRKPNLLTSGWIVALALTGCGRSDLPELATVTGKVTLDGSPLADAEVGFFPVKAGRPSFGKTNEKGEYSLQYLEGHQGATVGENTVQIRRAQSGEGVDPKKAPSELSEQYNDQTTLTKTVASGNNTADFELKTMDRKDGKKSAAPIARP